MQKLACVTPPTPWIFTISHSSVENQFLIDYQFNTYKTYKSKCFMKAKYAMMRMFKIYRCAVEHPQLSNSTQSGSESKFWFSQRREKVPLHISGVWTKQSNLPSLSCNHVVLASCCCSKVVSPSSLTSSLSSEQFSSKPSVVHDHHFYL